MAKLNKIRIASLFSGCGGLDLGFLGGFTFEGKKYKKHNTIIVFANDIDADAVICYNSNHLLSKKGNDCRLADIRDVNANEIPNFDVLLAGFPCQPFSNAGNRKGIQDDNGRGTLFEECERILKDKVESGNKPKAFVFENVRGIISSKMCNRKNESRVKSKRNAKFFIKTRCEIYFTHVIQKVKAFNQCFKID